MQDTPYGPNTKYTVAFHVVGEDKREDGSATGADRTVEIPVVTPLGASRAVALAALRFSNTEPRAIFREVEVRSEQSEFRILSEDVRDPESYGR